MINRRNFSIAAGIATLGVPAFAQSDVMRIVVGFPAGGIVDVIARELGEALKPHLEGRNVIVDNKPGAGGRIAVSAVKSATPDGNTVLLTPASIMTLYPHVFKKLPYDTRKDFAAVSTVCMSTNALAVGKHVPARTLGEFIAWCKANPKEATYASPGAGSGPHFLGAQIAQAAGIDMLHVPYKGAPDIMNDLYGGRVASFVTALSNALQPHKDGRMRVLVTTGEKRSAQLPDVQTAREAGFPQLTMLEWFGLLAPVRTPADKVAALHGAVQKAIASTSVQKSFETLVMEPRAMAPAEFATRIDADIARWGQTAKSLNYEAIDG
ncbi:tripartite tricarboxylate transporter substrate-binding protein [Comamonadaceae bacterium G21597-S1]|nr:tripartite tricarboxylate transporter substrate-binding protein [Comamonadaceae bacterium G21597-S1]